MAHLLKLRISTGVTDHSEHIVKDITYHLNLGSLVEFVVLIAHSRGGQVLIVFFLLLPGNYFVQFTNLLLHVLLGGRDRTEFCVDVLVNATQFIKNLGIEYSLPDRLGLNSVLTFRMGTLVLATWEIPVVRSRLVIVVDSRSLVGLWID